MLESKLVSSIINHLPLSIARVLLSSLNELGRPASDREKILHNLKLAFGSGVNERFLITTMVKNINFCSQNNVDALILLKAKKAKLIQYLKNAVAINNSDKLGNYYGQNNGVILLSFHCGSFYLIPAFLALHGFKITALSGLSSLNNRLFENRIKEISEEDDDFKLRLIPVGKMATKNLMKALKNKEMVFLLGDFNMGRDNGTARINFMNRYIYAGYGAAWLHLKTGAPIVPIFVDKQNSHHHITIEDPIEIEEQMDYKEITQEIFRIFEQIIRNQPEKWIRWKYLDDILYER